MNHCCVWPIAIVFIVMGTLLAISIGLSSCTSCDAGLTFAIVLAILGILMLIGDLAFSLQSPDNNTELLLA